MRLVPIVRRPRHGGIGCSTLDAARGLFVTNGPDPQWWASPPNPATAPTQAGPLSAPPFPPAPVPPASGWPAHGNPGFPPNSQPQGYQTWAPGPPMPGGHFGPPGGPPPRNRKPLI